MAWPHDSKPLGDHEFPEPDPDDEDHGVVICPECGAEVFEDLEQCSSCLYCFDTSQRPWAGKPVWWILLGLIGIVMTIFVLAGLAAAGCQIQQ